MGLTLIFISLVLFKKNNFIRINSSKVFENKDSKYDILNPKFIMNRTTEQIKITANEGNFINKNEILLKNNVIFESEKFKIFSDNVRFNKKIQTANSNQSSIFTAKKTRIESEGFKIVDQGEKIIFNGNTTLILSK
jgi:hypothetical protein|tara:strand:- start:184 stop:591 length:408 start_codon:yes stop_codon:yes gene_type:complete